MDNKGRQQLTQKLINEYGLLGDVAILGDGTGRIYVTGRPGYVWVRQEQTISESGRPIYTPPFPVRHHPNAIYKVSDGTRVQLFIDRDEALAIESADFESIVATGGNPAIYNPANPFNKYINPSQLTPLISHAIGTANTPSLKVAIRECIYITDGNVYNFFAGSQYNFTSDVPSTSGKKALALLYLSNNLVACAVGSDKDVAFGWGSDDVTEVVGLMPTTAIPIAIWELTNGMTTITEKQLYLDMRQWLNIPASSISTFPTTITSTITIPAGQQVVISKTTIGTGGKLVVNGRVRVV